MDSLTVLKIGLIAHLTGIVTMVGLTVANFVALQQLWKYLRHERDKALLIMKATSRFPLFQMFGGVLVVLGGITMMLAFHGVFMHQTWFKIKLGLLVLIILNAIFVARPAGKKLRLILSVNSGGEVAGNASGVTGNASGVAVNPAEAGMVEVKKRLTLFHLLQFLLFFVIFILSVFQFN